MFFDYTDPSIRYTGRFASYGGAMTATALDKYLRVNCTGGSHVLQVILKSSVEVHPPVLSSAGVQALLSGV